jgi:hypothetical protein
MAACAGQTQASPVCIIMKLAAVLDVAILISDGRPSLR